MGTDLEKEAPNVVTEPGLRRLLARGHEAEIVCQAEAYCKAAVWYGEWIIRVVSSDRTSEKLLCTTPRRVGDPDEIKLRVFKTINGLSSFMHRLGFTHAHIPFYRGGRSSQALPSELLGTDGGSGDDGDDGSSSGGG